MSDALPWLPLHHESYLADMQIFSVAECGAYFLLALYYWRKGGLPSEDEDKIRRIARMSPKEWKASRDTLMGCFSPEWTHARLDRERAKSTLAYNRKVEGGRRGGKASAAVRSGSRPPSYDAHDDGFARDTLGDDDVTF